MHSSFSKKIFTKDWEAADIIVQAPTGSSPSVGERVTIINTRWGRDAQRALGRWYEQIPATTGSAMFTVTTTCQVYVMCFTATLFESLYQANRQVLVDLLFTNERTVGLRGVN